MKDQLTNRLLHLLNLLNRKKLMFRLDQQSDDAVMVSFAFVGMRVEVEVFEDHIEFSTFSGDESVQIGEDKLFKLIEEKWGDA